MCFQKLTFPRTNPSIIVHRVLCNVRQSKNVVRERSCREQMSQAHLAEVGMAYASKCLQYTTEKLSISDRKHCARCSSMHVQMPAMRF